MMAGFNFGMHSIPLHRLSPQNPECEALSKDLKRRGFQFVRPVICYAHMQATGMVNDHALDCFRRQEIIDRYAGDI